MNEGAITSTVQNDVAPQQQQPMDITDNHLQDTAVGTVSTTEVEVPLTNGVMDHDTPDILERSKFLVGGGCGDNIEEVLNVTRLIVNSVRDTAPSHVVESVHYMTDFIVSSSVPGRGILIVEELLCKVHRDGILTTIHSDLLQLCVASKILSPARKYIDVDIDSITTDEEQTLDVKYVLQYYYYGGVIYSALRNFSRALHFFEICLSVPSQQTTSAIQVEAYQKYLLVSILCGQRTMPRVSMNLNIPYLCRPYLNLIQIAREEDADKFSATLAQMTPFLEKHNNLGLAKQALECLDRRNISKLQNTFISLKLEALATHLKLPAVDVERRLREMIMSGHLSAQICKKDGVLWFNKTNEQFDNTKAIQELTSSLQTCMQSYKKMSALNKALSLDPKLISKITESEERGKKDNQPSSSTWDFPAKTQKSKEILSFVE